MWKTCPPAETEIDSTLTCGAVPPAVFALAERFCKTAPEAVWTVIWPVLVQTADHLKSLGSVPGKVTTMSDAPEYLIFCPDIAAVRVNEPPE